MSGADGPSSDTSGVVRPSGYEPKRHCVAIPHGCSDSSHRRRHLASASATITGAVVDYIRDAVVRGQLSPGMALPVRLAEQLSTSRGTVREDSGPSTTSASSRSGRIGARSASLVDGTTRNRAVRPAAVLEPTPSRRAVQGSWTTRRWAISGSVCGPPAFSRGGRHVRRHRCRHEPALGPGLGQPTVLEHLNALHCGARSPSSTPRCQHR